MDISRRRFMQLCAATGASASVLADAVSMVPAYAATLAAGANPYGELQAPDSNGFRLPSGFTSRLLATSDELVRDTKYVWHKFPDGGAVFPSDDGGWVYVSNSEVPVVGLGGVGALRFDRDGEIVDAYSLLTGSTTNCAGGSTPSGTWMSCEETEQGRVFECWPDGSRPGEERPAFGRFVHEALAVDPRTSTTYLTEDRPDGRFYRVVGDGPLQAAVMAPDGAVKWLDVPDPTAATTPTRQQLPDSTAFAGGEGIWYHPKDAAVYFVTKGDNRVWRYDGERITRYFDPEVVTGTAISTVDNIVMNRKGDLFICEDQPTEQQLVIITAAGVVAPFAQLVGHDGSELAGLAFAPSGDRVYVSSQRGGTGAGTTYEIVGPFVDEQPPTTTTSTPRSTTTRSADDADTDDDGFPVVPVIGGAAAVVAVGTAAMLRLRNRAQDASS